jgi:DNA-binding NtrC family response regulator
MMELALANAICLPLTVVRNVFEREYLIFHLQKANGIVSDISKTIGRHRPDVYRMLEKFQLSANEYRAHEGNLDKENVRV